MNQLKMLHGYKDRELLLAELGALRFRHKKLCEKYPEMKKFTDSVRKALSGRKFKSK